MILNKTKFLTMKKNYSFFKHTVLCGMFLLSGKMVAQEVVIVDAESNVFNGKTLNVFANGTGESNADCIVVNNPHIATINTSAKVGKFTRRTNGGAAPWSGFYISGLNLDFSTNKYMHVKVLKTNTAPVKFKIEGGPNGNIEVASTQPYSVVGEWQDMVFDFSSASGTYPTAVFFPDFQDTVVDTGDLTIYFDDIILNNVATPQTLATKDFVKNDVKLAVSNKKLFFDAETNINTLNIYNVEGKNINIKQKFEKGRNIIDLSAFTNGVYYLQVNTKDGVVVKKFILK